MNDIEILIIRGASGVGKTSLMKTMKGLLDGSFCIDIDDIRSMLSDMDWDQGYTDYLNSQLITAAMLKEMDRLGYKRAVVADTFPNTALRSFLGCCPFRCRIVSIYCDDAVLSDRLLQRGRDVIRMKHIMSMNESIRMHDLDDIPIAAEDKLYIDNTHKTAEQIAHFLLHW